MASARQRGSTPRYRTWPSQRTSGAVDAATVEQRHEKAQVYGSRMEERLRGAGVVVLHGFAHLSGPHSLIYSDCDTQFETGMTADFIVVCTGARPRHPPRCHVDGLAVHDYKTIEEVDHRDLPASVAVIGGGVIAC